MESNPVIVPATGAVLQPFYVVAGKKLLLLAILTMGLYNAYWLYRHWRNQKEATGESIMPLGRTLLSIFFVHNLFARIDRKLNEVDRNHQWSPSALATGYVILGILSLVIGQVFTDPDPAVTTPADLLFIPLMVPTVYILYQVQQAANRACGDPAGRSNEKLTPLNHIWLAIGAAMWFFILSRM